MNYRDGKMLKISNSLVCYSSYKIEIQLREKMKTNFGKMDVEKASERSQNPGKYTPKCINRTWEDRVRHARASDYAPLARDHVPSA